MVSNETKHEISIELVDTLNAMSENRISFDDVMAVIARIAEKHPGDARQQAFYHAVRLLATKIRDGECD